MVISNNQLVLDWIDSYIHYLCNLYVSLSIHFNQELSLEDYEIFINVLQRAKRLFFFYNA